LPDKLHGHFAMSLEYLIDFMISGVHSFTETYLSDIDNIVPVENTTPINQNKKGQNKRTG